ncbi:TonB-dependent receptor [Massilia sp. GCM10023247]|uniref:TonB-dependent receptor n=1 Tax=Massilia sp. GCM10023247 TaxID=3252643 RepID=UPI00362343C5
MKKLKPLPLAVATACSLMVLSPAYAQQTDAETEGMASVVVTATRGAKAVDKIPGAVTVIGQKDLSMQYQVADDPSAALATFVPGYAPSRQKMSSTGESLRGRQPLILLDGIPQSNPLRAGMREGYFADSAIIERIEVISGASAVQGMGATGGIINYITKSPKTNGTQVGVNARASTQFRSDNLDWKTGVSVTHKNDDFDMLGYASVQRRGMSYDGRGRRVGIDNVQGDTLDTHGHDLFVKLGKDFGDQRIQLTLNRFNMQGDGDYRNAPGVVVEGVPTSSVRGTPEGLPPENKVTSTSLDYRHANLAGGAFTAQLFKQDFEALYGSTQVATFQDPAIDPTRKLWDQSHIVADKLGSRITWVRPDAFVQDLELTLGLDLLRDHTLQRLATTNRTWVPELKFESHAPFVQLEYEFGPVTVRGGLRHENAKLDVDTYTTLAAYNGGQRVEGGSTEFSKAVKNIGAVWRFAPEWSAFAGSSEGFGLPDAGLVLRGVNIPNQSVSNLINLQPIVTRNNEIGINWRGARGQVGLSRYDSRSKLGSVLRITAGVGRVERLPTVVKGWEVSGDWRPTKDWSVFGNYARTDGKTAATQGAPLDLALGARTQGPNKAVLGTDWRPLPGAQLRLQATHLFDRDINIGRSVGATKLEEHFKGYTLVDLASSMDTAYGRIGVSIENLLDKQYVGYYSQSAAALDAGNTYAGRGRTLAVTWSRMF